MNKNEILDRKNFLESKEMNFNSMGLNIRIYIIIIIFLIKNVCRSTLGMLIEEEWNPTE